jgi:hypothetical protein
MPNKEKDLEPVSDLRMVQRYLRYGLEFHEIVSCLAEDETLPFEAEFSSLDLDKLLLELAISKESFATLDSNRLSVIDRPRTGLRLSFSVNEATFFAQTLVQGRDARKLVVRAEMPMYKLQRRESMRIKVLESHGATIKLGLAEYPLFDISAGGLSIMVRLDQEKEFSKQHLFPGCTLAFLGKKLKVDLEVKNVLCASKDGLKWKVGFRFKALPPAVEQLIAREAYLHSHKIWSRWL